MEKLAGAVNDDRITYKSNIPLGDFTIPQGVTVHLNKNNGVAVGNIVNNGTLQAFYDLMVNGSITNNGTITTMLDATITGSIVNDGTFTMMGASTITGNVTNNSSFAVMLPTTITGKLTNYTSISGGGSISAGAYVAGLNGTSTVGITLQGMSAFTITMDAGLGSLEGGIVRALAVTAGDLSTPTPPAGQRQSPGQRRRVHGGWNSHRQL